jgi:hypothetical protein
MGCYVCENLERAFKARQREYIEARSDAYYLVSRKFAASKNVEMERARNELEEHRLVCAAARREPAFLPATVLLRFTQQEGLRGDPRQNASQAA